MKENYINVCFIVDESGSMYNSKDDVVGGFNSLVEKHRKEENGKCTISLFKFSDIVTECFIGKDVKEAGVLEYNPGGCTAMNDGIGIAIDRIGKWLAAMPEEERPMNNMIVVMTDGMENASKEYTFEQVQKMIKHQTEKYGWSFVYMGTDITDASVAEKLQFAHSCFSSRGKVHNSYDAISDAAMAYRRSAPRKAKEMCYEMLECMCDNMTSEFEKEVGKKIKNKQDKEKK